MTPAAKAIANTLMGDPGPRGIIYRAVRKAAALGQPAPSNIDLCDMTGLSSPSNPPRILSGLQRDGAVQVEKGSHERRITIVATGARTHVSDGFSAISSAEYARRGRMIAAARHRPSWPGEPIAASAQDTATAQAMENGSRRLADALREQLAARKPGEQRQRDARSSGTVSHPLSLDRPMPALREAPPASADHRPTAASREPCPRCGARGDLGCKHFAPFEMEDA